MTHSDDKEKPKTNVVSVRIGKDDWYLDGVYTLEFFDGVSDEAMKALRKLDDMGYYAIRYFTSLSREKLESFEFVSKDVAAEIERKLENSGLRLNRHLNLEERKFLEDGLKHLETSNALGLNELDADDRESKKEVFAQKTADIITFDPKGRGR